MAEPAAGTTGAELRRTSPLAHYEDRLAEASGSRVRIAEVPFVRQLTLRADPKGPGFDAVGAALGFSLPVEPNTVAGEPGGAEAFWLGPDEWLVLGAVEEALAGVVGLGALVDVSGQRTALEIAGPRARDVLAKGCTLDTHQRVFGPGQCAQTTYARAPIVLVPRDGDVYWLLVRASFAEYLAEFLIDAVTEYA